MKTVLTSAVRFYQLCVSPHFPPCCRFTPTCSAYALEAIRRHGAAKGALLAAKRLLRCNPFHKGGYDPVP
ncbi:MAG: membrane protein insertion efficiency factor YidD [Clostridiales bacterium]|jgi:putative membrane protein insertion efficiency factor|nr:membrane protein insertion efficiency factor YidD [Clostridiales bacterium]